MKYPTLIKTPSAPREFVEGRLEAVQSLLGISYRGRAIAGVVGLPFPQGGGPSLVLCGVVGSPSKVTGLPSSYAIAGEEELVVAISADLCAKEVPPLQCTVT